MPGLDAAEKQSAFATLQWAQVPFEHGHDWQGASSRSSGGIASTMRSGVSN